MSRGVIWGCWVCVGFIGVLRVSGTELGGIWGVGVCLCDCLWGHWGVCLEGLGGVWVSLGVPVCVGGGEVVSGGVGVSVWKCWGCLGSILGVFGCLEGCLGVSTVACVLRCVCGLVVRVYLGV